MDTRAPRWQGRHTYSDGSRLFLSMAEDIGEEGGGVPGGGGAPFVARCGPAAGTRTPSGARAPPLLRLFWPGRSGGELAPPRSRTVTALPSNAKERERVTGLRARRGRGGDRGAQPGPGGCRCCRCSGLNLPSRSRRPPPPPPPPGPARLARGRTLCAARGMVRARPAARSPSHLPPGARRAARRRGQGGGGGLGAGRGSCLSPWAPPSLGKVYFRSASLCLWFHFLFLITIQIQ